MDEKVPGWGVALQKDVATLQHGFAELKEDKEKAHDEFWRHINAIKDALNHRLPLWTTFLISGLMSATVGLSVYVATRG